MKPSLKNLAIGLAILTVMFFVSVARSTHQDIMVDESTLDLPPAHPMEPPATITYDRYENMTITEEDGSSYMVGETSWYDWTFNPDGSTRTCMASKENCYTEDKLVAASRDFPRYSWVRVTNISNGLAVDVRIQDFGPDASVFPNRIVDLSSFAFSQIADLREGVVMVRVEAISDPTAVGEYE